VEGRISEGQTMQNITYILTRHKANEIPQSVISTEPAEYKIMLAKGLVATPETAM